MNLTKTTVLLICIVGSLQTNSAAMPVFPAVRSAFDIDSEGWFPTNPGEGLFEYAPIGGNGGGFYHFQDGASGGGFISAPVTYLGDWSGLDTIGVLRYDHKIVNLGESATAIVDYEVVVTGDSGNARARFISAYPEVLMPPTDLSPTSWNTLTVPILESEWTVLSGKWASLLADVESLEIRIEQVDNGTLGGPGIGAERDGIDNVYLGVVPVPSALLLLLAPILVVFKRATHAS